MRVQFNVFFSQASEHTRDVFGEEKKGGVHSQCGGLKREGACPRVASGKGHEK